MANQDLPIKEYDFTMKDPTMVLTEDEFYHFEEGMRLKNDAFSADQVDFKRAVQATIADIDNLLS